MSANEMFNDCNFYKQDEGNYVLSYRNNDTGVEVYFDLLMCDLSVDGVIHKPLLDAINKQVEELGWK